MGAKQRTIDIGEMSYITTRRLSSLPMGQVVVEWYHNNEEVLYEAFGT